MEELTNDILSCLIKENKDSLGRVEGYCKIRYHYAQIRNNFLNSVSSEEFKALIMELHQKNYLTWFPDSSQNDGSIQIEQEGYDYYLNHVNKREIGFH